MKLRLTDPALIDGYRKEIQAIGDSVNDPLLFDRIQKACREKQAFLFVSRDGFIVLKPMAGKRLLVWVAHSFFPVDRLAYACEIERFARDIECAAIAFWSNRPGFKRFAPNFGFSPMPAEWMGKPITVWTKLLTY